MSEYPELQPKDVEKLTTLCDSDYRIPIFLKILNGTEYKKEIKSELNIADRTMGRNVSTLLQLGLITQSDEENRQRTSYHPTPFATEAADKIIDTVSTLERIAELNQFYEEIYTPDMGLDKETLSDVQKTGFELVNSTDERPTAAIAKLVELISEASDVRKFVNAPDDTVINGYESRIEAEELEGEFIFKQPIMETYLSIDRYNNHIRTLLRHGKIEVYVYPDDFRFSLNIFDGKTVITTPNGDTIFITESKKMKNWAESKIKSVRSSSEPMEDWLQKQSNVDIT
jgi:predicted transcriptional regulator